MVGEMCDADTDPGRDDLCCSTDGYFLQGSQTSADYSCEEAAEFSFDCSGLKGLKCRMKGKAPYNCKLSKGVCSRMSMCEATKPKSLKLNKARGALKKAMNGKKAAAKQRASAQKRWKDAGSPGEGDLRQAFIDKKMDFAAKEAELQEAQDAVDA